MRRVVHYAMSPEQEHNEQSVNGSSGFLLSCFPHPSSWIFEIGSDGAMLGNRKYFTHCDDLKMSSHSTKFSANIHSSEETVLVVSCWFRVQHPSQCILTLFPCWLQSTAGCCTSQAVKDIDLSWSLSLSLHTFKWNVVSCSRGGYIPSNFQYIHIIMSIYHFVKGSVFSLRSEVNKSVSQ